MRRLKARKVNSPNGEVHFILEEPPASEHSERFKDYDVDKIKKVLIKEAAKPLILLREE
jgi:hypothetical protein